MNFNNKIKRITNYYKISKKGYFLYFLLFVFTLGFSLFHNYALVLIHNKEINSFNKRASNIYYSLNQTEEKRKKKLENLRATDLTYFETEIEKKVNKFKQMGNPFKSLGFEITNIDKKEIQTKEGTKYIVKVNYKLLNAYRSSYITAMYIISIFGNDHVSVKNYDLKRNYVLFIEKSKNKKELKNGNVKKS